MKTWEERRAVVLGQQMDDAIARCDKEAFMSAFSKAMNNYMRKPEYTAYWKRFREACKQKRMGAK